MRYQVFVLLHLLGVLVFFANFVAAFLWRARAERSGDPRLLAYAYGTLNVGDARLTPFAVAAILAGGVGAALRVGLPIFGTGWILWSLVSFALSGLAFAVRVLPLQLEIAARAEEGLRTGRFDLAAHQQRARAWAHWAHVSFGTAALSLPLMVFKPWLPAW